MKALLFLILIVISSFSVACSKEETSAKEKQLPTTCKKLIVGYLRAQKWTDYDWTKISYAKLTHIIQYGLTVTSSTNPTLKYSGQPFDFDAMPLTDKSFGGWSNQLIPAAHNVGTKVVLGLAMSGPSAGNSPFQHIISNRALKETLIANIVTTIKSYGFDGVDLDYEYPNSKNSGDSLSLFIYDLYASIKADKDLGQKMVTISLAIPKFENYGKWFDYALLQKCTDWFGVMTYGFDADFTQYAGHNAPLYLDPASPSPSNSTDFCVRALTETRLIPKEKLLLGLPFYGFVHYGASTLYAQKSASLSKKYYDIVKSYLNQSGYNCIWSETAKAPYLVNPLKTGTYNKNGVQYSYTGEIVSYDNEQSLGQKCDYAIQKGLGGVMIWELGQGYVSGSSKTQPLLDAIYSKFHP